MSRKTKPSKRNGRKRKDQRSNRSLWAEKTLQAAVARHQAGLLDEAASLYREVLEVVPKNANALHLLGVVSHQSGDPERAIQYISQAIGVNAAAPDFHLNLGSAYLAMGRLDEAIGCFERSLQLNSKSAVAHNNLGNALKKKNRTRDSLAHYKQSLRLNPDYAEAHSNLGVALMELGNADAALASLQRALQINPRLVEAQSNLGIVQSRRGEGEAAVEAYRNALQLQPRLAEAWSNLGNVLKEQGKISEAKEAYRQVGETRQEPLWKFRSELLCPVIPESNQEVNDYRSGLEAAIEAFDKIQLTGGIDELTTSNCEFPYYLSYQGGNDRRLKSRYAKLFSHEFPSVEPQFHDGIAHVGFVVTDRRERVFVRFMRGILNRLASNDLKVTIACSSNGQPLLNESLLDERIEYVTMPNRLSEAANAIRSAAIDMLFYFEPGTDSLSYFLPFCQASPLQCTSWGIPVTTGIPTMDYFISSKLIEQDGSDGHYTEQLVRLDTLPVCYERPESPMRPKDRDELGQRQQDHLYLCPQSLFKFHPDFDDALASILRTDPLGKILLIEGTHPHWKQLLEQRFRRTMPDVAERIVFLPRQSHHDFVGLLQICNVMLDSHPFGGGATTYEALAVGIPIVTLPANYMRGRVTAGCYRNMDMMDCVANSFDDYVQRAVRLGTDQDYREAIHSAILSKNEVLYDDVSAVDEMREFFFDTVYSARAESGGSYAENKTG